MFFLNQLSRHKNITYLQHAIYISRNENISPTLIATILRTSICLPGLRTEMRYKFSCKCVPETEPIFSIAEYYGYSIIISIARYKTESYIMKFSILYLKSNIYNQLIINLESINHYTVIYRPIISTVGCVCNKI